MWLTGLAAPWHVESSGPRDRACVPCIGRQILNHWPTRNVLEPHFYDTGVETFSGVFLCQSRLSLKYSFDTWCENKLYNLQELLQQSLWEPAPVNVRLLPCAGKRPRGPAHLHLVHFLSVPGCERQPSRQPF